MCSNVEPSLLNQIGVFSSDPVPPPISTLPEEIIVHIFSFLRKDDIGAFERASRRFYIIASKPVNPIHTADRLSCRDLALYLDVQVIEKVQEAFVQCPTDFSSPSLSGGSVFSGLDLFKQYISIHSRVSESLNQFLKSFKQYLIQSNGEGKAKELNNAVVVTAGKLIKGVLKSGPKIADDAQEAGVRMFYNEVLQDLIDSYVEQSSAESYKAKVNQIAKIFSDTGIFTCYYIETKLRDALDKQLKKGLLLCTEETSEIGFL
jgi:hypothetical protein